MILQESTVKDMDHRVVRQATDDPGERTLSTKGGVIINDVPAEGLISTGRRNRGREDKAELRDTAHVRTLHSAQLRHCDKK